MSLLIQNLIDESILFNSVFIDGKHEIALCLPNEDVIATSNTSFNSKIELEKMIDTLKEVLSNTNVDGIKAITKCYAFYNDYAVDETFFSFKMSFIMPSWPVRFQDKNFQQFFKNTVYKEIPIHIVADSYWLPYKALYEFEKVYFKWLKLILTDDTSEDRMHDAYELILLLQKFNEYA